jgi:7,8-dihydroneopterin aldolase/epimerase/oxygenase
MKDTLFIHGLTAETYIGIHEWEQHSLRTVELDLELLLDISAINEDSDFSQYVDYETVCAEVTALIQAKSYRLLESLAQDITQHILRRFNVSCVKLAVHKKDIIDNVKKVGFYIERSACR